MQPSLIQIMPSRAADFEAAALGYAQTGIPLVAFDGTRYLPAGAGSDPGTFYFVPKLASLVGAPALVAADVMLVGSIVLGVASAIVAALLLCRSRLSRANAVASLLLVGIVAFMAGDQYVIAPAVTLPLVLWFLVLWRRATHPRSFAIFLASVGIIAGLANVSRAHAATAVAIFIAGVIFLDGSRAIRQRVVLVAALLAGMAVAPLWFHILTQQRDSFLAGQYANYHPPHPAHPFWHSVYIGFGYLDNPHVTAYRDEVAAGRVEQLAPGTPFVSREYDRILRREVVRLVVREPLFAVHTLFAKLGAVALHLIIFAHVGLLAALRGASTRRIEALWWVTLAFSALPGLLVMPWPGYLSGFIAVAAIYGIVSVDAALHHNGRRFVRKPPLQRTGGAHEPVHV